MGCLWVCVCVLTLCLDCAFVCRVCILFVCVCVWNVCGRVCGLSVYEMGCDKDKCKKKRNSASKPAVFGGVF